MGLGGGGYSPIRQSCASTFDAGVIQGGGMYIHLQQDLCMTDIGHSFRQHTGARRRIICLTDGKSHFFSLRFVGLLIITQVTISVLKSFLIVSRPNCRGPRSLWTQSPCKPLIICCILSLSQLEVTHSKLKLYVFTYILLPTYSAPPSNPPTVGNRAEHCRARDGFTFKRSH